MADHNDPQDSFADMLRMLSMGAFHEDVTAAVESLVSTMEKVSNASGGIAKGAITLTLKFKLDRGLMEIDPTYKVTTPSTPRTRTIMYPDGKGHLRRNNFHQPSLPGMETREEKRVETQAVKTVEAPQQEIRTVPENDTSIRSIDHRMRAANDRE